MAHHQKHHFEPAMSGSTIFPLEARPVGPAQPSEEDDVADVDEPPEHHLSFGRLPLHTPAPDGIDAHSKSSATRSLLSKGLLTGSNLRSMVPIDTSVARAQSTTSNNSAWSGVSTADLTSDGGLTSPARTSTPSPPLPATFRSGLPMVAEKDIELVSASHPVDVLHLPPPVTTTVVPEIPGPPKRRITFACTGPAKEKTVEEAAKAEETPKRKCMLRFACPLKPTSETETPGGPRRASPAPMNAVKKPSSPPVERAHRDSQSTAKGESSAQESPKTTPSSPEAARSDSMRFHAFAAAKREEESWITAKPSTRQKITVSDTLRKENAIRKLGQEAEEEALEEENDEDDAESNDDGDEDDEDEDFDSEEDASDGNETDDEEGFAASDDDSEGDPEYQFWTPAATTAATSTDQIDNIRPRQHRSPSESSIESMINTAALPMERMNRPPKHVKPRGHRSSPKMRPGTPELPDSTDFVCGTLDEDRPLEVAYLSCMEQRKIAKHGVIAQDIDPSFPTSDPEDGEDDDDEDEENVAEGSDGQAWITGKPDESDDGVHLQRSRANTGRKGMGKSPAPSPKRMRSPPPKRRNKSPAPMASKRTHAARSPPPRKLFGHSPRRMPSPPPRNVASPPSSRRNSFTREVFGGIDLPTLAQRPHLTHTKSLPRTPNPFWTDHRRVRLAALRRTGEDQDFSNDSMSGMPGDPHSRGPIDIVQGLERKRLRRKEKFWQKHCRHNLRKDKDHRVQPGKGAERMRDVGIEMADRCKGYGQRLQLVLSV